MNRGVLLPSRVRKPEDLSRDSVPIGTSKLGRKMVCIEYPGIVNNLSKALNTLGGLDDINTRYSDSNQRLELRWRPEDPYCKSSYGDSSATNNLLLSFKKRRKKRADGTFEYEHKVEIIGTVKVTYRFQGMVDFQYLPMIAKPSSPGSQDKEYLSIFDKLIVKNPGDIKNWLHNDVPLFLPPIIFSRMDMPMEYLFRSEMQHRAGFINPQDQRPSHLIGTARQRRSHHTIFVNFDDKTIPEGAMAGAEAALRPKVKNLEVEEKLRALFKRKPIWSRNGICCNIDSRRDNLKYILPLVAYYFITGPWRSLWVRFGYDPRKDPSAKRYQIVDFRVRQRSGNDIINIKAKRSTFSYKLPTVVSKQTSQVATINRSELIPSKEMQEAPPSSKTNAESTYKFRADYLPPFRQMFYQICDIEDEDVQALLIQNDGQDCIEESAGRMSSVAEQSTTFSFGDVLPSEYEVIAKILEVAPSGQPTEEKETRLRKQAVSDCAKGLMITWSKAFSASNVLSAKSVKKKIRKSLQSYYNAVTTSKKKKRRAEMEFKKEHSELFDIKGMAVDPEKFAPAEKTFYYDQLKMNRNWGIDLTQVDEEFEKEMEDMRQKEAAEVEMMEDELSYIMDEVVDTLNSTTVGSEKNSQEGVSMNRSGLVRVLVDCADAASQTDQSFKPKPEIRNIRNCTEAIKKV